MVINIIILKIIFVTFIEILKRMKNNIKFFAIIFSAILLFSCKEKTSYSKIESTNEVLKSSSHKIVVNEFVDGGGYAYVNVMENGESYWMAIPNSEVEIGKTYYYDGGMVMKDFESKHLNKTFESIVFAEGLRATEKAVKKQNQNPHSNTKHEHSPILDVKIATPTGGTSLKDIFENKESLLGKELLVKGKVVKVNNGILDKNWVHIVDGSKFETKSSLTITTTEVVKVGDTVTFKGNITLNKDFGYGYVYDILLEEGKLLK